MNSTLLSYQVVIPTLLCLIGALVLLLENQSSRFGVTSFLGGPDGRLARLPDRTLVQERLEKIRRGHQYAEFRNRQFTVASASALLGAVILTSLASPPFVTLLISISIFLGVCVIIDRRLSMEVVRYRLSVENEFAALIEMLTLSLSAGETPLAAMARLARQSRGALSREFGIVVDSVKEGSPFHVALDAMGRRVDSVVIRRFVDALVTAMLRGAPLVDVLQRHAAEARQNQRNILMNKAGKAEISMMVPVVFLILPVSVLFALWPSLTHLNFFAS
ncbi:MAG: type II secretion system F family protein [Candidatus Nanopelagicaceae bacterium]|nr:type II secretion system F family protein [Candidatus Nanopelagicaceae bacterium]